MGIGEIGWIYLVAERDGAPEGVPLSASCWGKAVRERRPGRVQGPGWARRGGAAGPENGALFTFDTSL